MIVADEVEQQTRGVDVGEHRARRTDVVAACPYADRAAVAHDDIVDRRVALDPAAYGNESGHESVGQAARASLRDGPSDVLAEAGQDPTEDPAQHVAGGEIGMQRCTCDE